MKTMNRILRYVAHVALLGAVLLGVPATSHAQTVLNTTTAAAAYDASQTAITLTSVTNVSTNTGPTAAWKLFWPDTGEIMEVRSINTTTGVVQVRRGAEGTLALPNTSGNTVIIARGDGLTDKDMGGSCTRGSGYASISPLINRTNGWMWVCINSAWQGATRRAMTLNSLPPFTP